MNICMLKFLYTPYAFDERGNFMKKLLSVILAFVLVFSLCVIPASANGTHASKGATVVNAGDVVQGQFTTSSTAAYYKITATDTMYYKFTFTNQSVELKTGISIADSFLNLFFAKFDVQITDQYDADLANLTVRCGYSGNVSLKLTKGQTYYIKITTNADGYYKMAVDAFVDIAGNSWNTAYETMSVGQLISSIDADGDKDWFYFQTDDTDSFYNFDLENISGSSTMHMYLYEYVEGAGQVPLRDTFSISASRSDTANKLLKLKPNTKYYLCIYLNSGIGGYQLDIKQTLDAVGDTQENAYKVDTDTKVTTALDGKGDVDWFKFTTKDYDAYYYFNMDNLSIDNDYFLYVYDAAGNEIGFGRSYSDYGISKNFKLSPNTEYYFKIYALSSGTGNYNFVINDIADSHANEQENATQIQLDREISACVSGDGDIDFFKFTTEDFDAYYYFDMENLSIDNDYFLYVYDKSGNEIGFGRSYSNYGISKNFKLSPNTEYYFEIHALSSATGNYKVAVTAEKDSYPNTQAEAKKISLNEEIFASVTGSGDIDYFKFTTEDFDAYYYFDMENLSIDNDYFLYVYDKSGNEIGFGRSYSNYGISKNFKLSPNTEYYFEIHALSSATGNYKVTVSYVADAEGDVKEKAAEISLNKSITRELSSDDDVDWFKFTLDYDCNIRMVATNESGSSKRFVLYSAINKEFINFTCYSSTEKTQILDAGEYYIKVYDNDGYYTLAIGDCGSAHKEDYRYVQATDSADGIKTTYCKSCKKVIKKEVIPRIDKVSLSYTKGTYSGNVKKPSVTAYDVNGDKISSSQYKVTYSSGRVNVGTYTATVEFTGKYAGTKTLKFKVVPLASSKLKLKLSTTSYTYNGKAKKPSVKVYNSKGDLVTSGNYKVEYPSGRKNVGSYKVKVVFKGNYSGTEYLTFKVNPAKTTVKKLTAGKKSLKVSITKKSTQVTGYQVQYSTSKSFKAKYTKTKTISSYKTTSATLKSLKAKKTYYVRVRTYKTVNGKKYYSGWSSYKTKKTK